MEALPRPNLNAFRSHCGLGVSPSGANGELESGAHSAPFQGGVASTLDNLALSAVDAQHEDNEPDGDFPQLEKPQVDKPDVEELDLEKPDGENRCDSL